MSQYSKLLCPRGLGPPAAKSFWVVHMYIHLSTDQVKIFGLGRILRPIDGSKLIFHMRIYLYETSRNIQEPWPHDLYFVVHWLRTLARLSRLRFLSKLESQGLLMVASWYFIWWCIFETSRNIQEPWPHDLYFTIYWLRTLARLSKLRCLPKVESQDLLMVASWYFIERMYLYETSRTIQRPWPPDLYFTVCWLQTLADFPWLIFSSSVHAWALLMVARYFIRGFTSVTPAASAFMPSVHEWGWG